MEQQEFNELVNALVLQIQIISEENHFGYFLKLEETIEFVYYLFCITRGVKNRQSLDIMSKFVITHSNRKIKALKIKELFSICINELIP